MSKRKLATLGASNHTVEDRVYISSSRITCAKGGDFEKMKKGGGSAISYAWYVWEKGFTDDTQLKWIN